METICSTLITTKHPGAYRLLCDEARSEKNDRYREKPHALNAYNKLYAKHTHILMLRRKNLSKFPSSLLIYLYTRRYMLFLRLSPKSFFSFFFCSLAYALSFRTITFTISRLLRHVTLFMAASNSSVHAAINHSGLFSFAHKY